MRVVATVNLPGLAQGEAADADPKVPYVANCLQHGFLIPLEPVERKPEQLEIEA